MSRDIRDLLHGAAPDPSGRPDVDAIRRRGRTLVATRLAALVGVVVLAAAGATGLVLQILPDEDVPPPVIEEPSPEPAPTGDQGMAACAPVQRWPAYLPWMEEGASASPPDAVVEGRPGAPDSRAYWAAEPETFDPDGSHDAPVVTVAVHHESDWEPDPDAWRPVEVAGHEGELRWVGDPGVGGVAVLWREDPGPCGTHSVSLLTYRLGDYVDRPWPAEPPDEEIDQWMVDLERVIEEELIRVAQSLVPWRPDEPVETCAVDDGFPEISDEEVRVFFYCDDPEAFPAGLYATVRSVPADREPLEVALEALAAGPTATERDAGFRSTLAEMGEIGVLETVVDGSTAVIDLTGLPDELTQEQRSFLPPGFLEEIAWTVFHNDDAIDAIELRLDGSCDDFWQLLTGEECRLYTRNQWGHIPEE